MASSVSTSQGRESLPPLSQTHKSSQMLTPRYLERITIDDPRYHGFLKQSIQTEPPHLNALQRRCHKMGDQYFFVHKDIPLHQPYNRTSIKLSDVRPWDEIVAKPLSSHAYRVLQKEVNLPFPTEHPYTSHMSRFAVFPDTQQELNQTLPPSSCSFSVQSRPNTADVQTQTPRHDVLPEVSPKTPRYDVLPEVSPKAPPTYYVLQKASERGQRIECRYMSTPAPVDVRSGNMLWDLPRSQRHKRALTYPAPTLRFAPLTSAPLTTSSSTRHGLDTAHKIFTRTTTYSEQYPGHYPGAQNILRLDTSHYARMSSHRPHTGDSRGKYYKGLSATVDNPQEEEFEFHQVMGDDADSDTERQAPAETVKSQSADTSASEGNKEMAQSEVKETVQGSNDQTPAPLSEPIPTSAGVKVQTEPQSVTKIDKSTQTYLPTSTSLPPYSSEQYRLPQLSKTAPQDSQCRTTLPISHSTRPKSATEIPPLKPRYTDSSKYRPYTADVYTPRSALSTRRLMTLYNGFSMTEVLRRFHAQYPEEAPDLRDYNIREGKRHVIHGNHAYYFH